MDAAWKSINGRGLRSPTGRRFILLATGSELFSCQRTYSQSHIWHRKGYPIFACEGVRSTRQLAFSQILMLSRSQNSSDDEANRSAGPVHHLGVNSEESGEKYWRQLASLP